MSPIHNTLRVFIPGGILSPGDLLKICDACRSAGIKDIAFGSRQEILARFDPVRKTDLMSALMPLSFHYDLMDSQAHNIVSSFPAAGLLPSTSWMIAGTYLDILESFHAQPRLKVNIVDPQQGLVPPLSGHLNFLCSAYPNYWQLYVIFPESNRKYRWPVLVDTSDIARLAAVLEDEILVREQRNFEWLFESTNNRFSGNSRLDKAQAGIPQPRLPYYEGINRMLGHNYWLGVYRRDDRFSVDFLAEAAELCLGTKLGKVSLTPWKSLLIKEIQNGERFSWEKLLGRFGINIRHSSHELGWHIPDFEPEALRIKDELVVELDRQDVRTFGLSFAVYTRTDFKIDNVSSRTSIVLSKNAFLGSKVPFRQAGYNIHFDPQFNAASPEYELYKGNVPWSELPSVLMDLCAKFYRQLNENSVAEVADQARQAPRPDEAPAHQCPSCLSIYDPRFGDVLQEILPGVPFSELPEDYCCAVCGGPKMAFRPLAAAAR